MVKETEGSVQKCSERMRTYGSLVFSRKGFFCPGSVSLRWISPAFDVDPRLPVTRQHLRDFLASSTNIFGHALCPHVSLNDGQLFIAFEQNQCTCFDGPSHQNVPTSHDCHSPLQGKCCRCVSDESPSRRGYFMPTENPFRVFGEPHSYQCAVCQTTYFWKRDQSHPDRVCLCATRYVFARTPTSREWLINLNPESWNITEDKDLRHITWCPNSLCRTAVRWAGMLQVLRPYMGWT